jgi:hypothetical protein
MEKGYKELLNVHGVAGIKVENIRWILWSVYLVFSSQECFVFWKYEELPSSFAEGLEEFDNAILKKVTDL